MSANTEQAGTAVQPLEQIRARLRKARKIWRVSETLARCFRWAECFLGGLLLLAVLDNLCDLPGALRLMLGLAAVLGGAGVLAAWALRPLFWRINDQAAAVYLERKTGEKENLLINAVQFGASLSGPGGVRGSAELLERIIARAGSRAAELSTGPVWDKKRLKRAGLAAAAAGLALLLYAVLMFTYAQHAWLRYVKPLSGVPPLSQTRIAQYPAGEQDVLSGDSLTVQGLAGADKGVLPRDAFLLAEADGAVRRMAMEPARSACPELARAFRAAQTAAFVCELPNITKPFTFHLVCGDGRSMPCHVRVRERPAIEDLHLELSYPPYTGLRPARQPLPNGLVQALNGSQAVLVFSATRPLSGAAAALPDGTVPAKPRGQQWEISFPVVKEGPYSVALQAKDGIEARHALDGQILPQPDALPSVAFDAPSLSLLAAPGSALPLAVKAQDDFGVKRVRVLVRKQSGDGDDKETDFSVLKEWAYALPGRQNANELLPLALDPQRFPCGETFIFVAECCDHCPLDGRTVRSAPLAVHLLTPGQMAPGAGSPFETVFKRIQELINQETKARGKTASVREFIDEQKNVEKRLESMQSAQKEVNGGAQRLASDLEKMRTEKGKESASGILAGLRSVISGPMTAAVNKFPEIFQARRERAELIALLQKEEALQTEIISRLTALLGTLSNTGNDKKKESEEPLADGQENQRLRQKLEDAKEKIDAFITAEKKIIQSTEELEKKNPLDLTENDLKKLGDLAKEEEEWAKYFREKFTDLSKVPDQDFSNQKLAQEFNEVYQEIQKAADALQAKNTEIAVRNEESGLELAKTLQTNIEKWLPDTRDTQKWNMEEPQGQFDVPLADIPEELEDIIGDLVDKEEEMTDDVEDTSSSWMDSMDKGAGWDAMDGNISNMSAKGVTGNRLPNQHEIGGRSGEGRSGKSTGQFVEETADGKGGRQTPSRATSDPYESGQVDDKSKDAIGGSTGGGKLAGGAAGGLRGNPPPATAQKMERLKDTQAQLRQQAEKVVTQLRAYHLPSSDMEEAVRRMDNIGQKLESKQGFNLRQAHSDVIDSLKKEKSVMSFQAKINKERSRDLPENVRHNILSGMQQKAPEGYQDLLEAYYKALIEKEK